MARVFISHSANDHEAASRLCVALEAHGLRCWVAPRDIPAGEQYATAIMQAIQTTDAMVVMFSEHSNASQHVHREVERAVNYRKKIYPVAIDASPSSGALDYLLATLQWTDASLVTPQATIENAAEQLAEALIGESQPAPPAPAPPPSAEPLEPAADLLLRPVEIIGSEDGTVLVLKNRLERALAEFLGTQGLQVAHGASLPAPKHELAITVTLLGEEYLIDVSLYKQGALETSTALEGSFQFFQTIIRSLPEALFYGLKISPKTLRRTPQKKRPTQAVEAFAFYLLARHAFTAQKPEDALAHLATAFEFDDRFAMAQWAMGEIHSALGNDRDAMEYKARAALLDADHPKLPVQSKPTNPMPALLSAIQQSDWIWIQPGFGWREIAVSSYGLAVRAWAIDPTQFEIETAVQLAETGSTVQEIRTTHNALLAVAGGFYELDARSRLSPAGMLVVDRLVLNGYEPTAGSGLFYRTDATTGIDWSRLHADDVALSSAIQSGPMVVDPGGKNGINSNDYNRLDRIAIGLSGPHFVIVVVKGEQEGISLFELGEILARDTDQGGFGCERAVNLSGGPTSQVSFALEDYRLEQEGLWPVQNAIIVRKHAG